MTSFLRGRIQRCKGFQKACTKTLPGATEYKRRGYVDETVESKRCGHLLDKEPEMDKVSLVPEKVNQIAATAVCETTCQGAKLITEATGLNISGRGAG